MKINITSASCGAPVGVWWIKVSLDNATNPTRLARLFQKSCFSVNWWTKKEKTRRLYPFGENKNEKYQARIISPCVQAPTYTSMHHHLAFSLLFAIVYGPDCSVAVFPFEPQGGRSIHNVIILSSASCQGISNVLLPRRTSISPNYDWAALDEILLIPLSLLPCYSSFFCYNAAPASPSLLSEICGTWELLGMMAHPAMCLCPVLIVWLGPRLSNRSSQTPSTPLYTFVHLRVYSHKLR